jgi:hypothetical protein
LYSSRRQTSSVIRPINKLQCSLRILDFHRHRLVLYLLVQLSKLHKLGSNHTATVITMADRNIVLDPNEIAFSMRTISPNFSGCGRGVKDTLNDLLTGKLKPEDVPPIAVIAHPYAPPPAPAAAAKKGKRGGKRREEPEEVIDEGSSGGSPASTRFRYFSLNNRRLWVFRRAREAGVVLRVTCRLKPPDVCLRLLDPTKKGSRSFRLDRVCDDAKLDSERTRRLPPSSAEHAERAEEDGHGEQGEAKPERRGVVTTADPTVKGEPAKEEEEEVEANDCSRDLAQTDQRLNNGCKEEAARSDSGAPAESSTREPAVILSKKEKRALAKRDRKGGP